MRVFLVVISFFCLVVAQHAHSWVFEMDCEIGTPNQAPPSVSGVTWGTLSTITSSASFSGSRSCRADIKKGSEGWPSTGGPLEWGNIFSFPDKVRVGEELWLRFALYVPETFPISTDGNTLKFIRLKTRVADPSKNTGCLDFFMANPSSPIWDPVKRKDMYPPFVVNFEGAPGLNLLGERPINDVLKGTWETYEIYVMVDSVPVEKGGKGLMKVWKNNQLVANLENQVLVADSTGYMDAFFFFTYWNGSAPADTYALIDDLIMTTDTPSNRDSQSFPFIGGETKLSRPNPPVAVVK